MFGVKILPTTKIAAGTALIIDTTQAVVAWTRMGLRTDVNYYGNLAVEVSAADVGAVVSAETVGAKQHPRGCSRSTGLGPHWVRTGFRNGICTASGI